MKKVRYTPEAKNDLSEIKKYISEELKSPIAATNTVSRITKRIRDLEHFPELGEQLSSIIDIDSDYRFLVCANYISFYRLDGNDVYIIRVIHGKRDYAAVLFGEPPSEEEKEE